MLDFFGGKYASIPAGATFGVLNNIGASFVLKSVKGIGLHRHMTELQVSVFLILTILFFNYSVFIMIPPARIFNFFYDLLGYSLRDSEQPVSLSREWLLLYGNCLTIGGLTTQLIPLVIEVIKFLR